MVDKVEARQKILEEDLFEPVRELLEKQGYKVQAEVNHCDIAAVKDGQLVIVELKRNLSVDLLVQAVKRQKMTDLVYIAVPKPKKLIYTPKWADTCHLIRRLELGLMVISIKKSGAYVEVPIQPLPFDRGKSKRKSTGTKALLLAEMGGRHGSYNTGGCTGKKLMTAYRESSLYIACCLAKFGPLSPKKLRELGADKKKAASILQKNFYNWFYRVRTGLYDLTDEGQKALRTYSELAELLNREIESQAGSIN